jgi:dsDNA-specific endonuclease/ATPase MutS2|tara:strand:- start:697 stop:1242 length:546 start_codon:yes stop_codon:yes gene_type:complete
MRFQIGQKVAVLDDILKGEVVSVNGSVVAIRDVQGMLFSFEANELVVIEVRQSELSKFSDINHPLLKQKMIDVKKKKSAFITEKKEVILEVDLHINQLTKSTRGMDNFDMLTLQLNTARSKVEYAIQKRISKLVFIHGVGAGVLKTELNYLLNKYPVKYYDASYKKYGLGATEVYIYQNPN